VYIELFYAGDTQSRILYRYKKLVQVSFTRFLTMCHQH